MKHTPGETHHSVIHIDCHEPRLAQVRKLVSSFPHDEVSFFQYIFKRGPGKLSSQMRYNLSSVSHHTRGKIACIFSAQLLDKEGCEELLNDIKLFHQQVLVILFTCLSEQDIRRKYKDCLALIHDPIVYVEYDAEKAEYCTFPIGEVVLGERLLRFLYPEKT